MTFTKELPTTPGFYAWIDSRGFCGAIRLVQDGTELKDSLSGVNVRFSGMGFAVEWCRLVPAKEIAEAWSESRLSLGCFGECHEATSDDLDNVRWNHSRAKQVMEGKQ